jgi:hypothetical protein
MPEVPWYEELYYSVRFWANIGLCKMFGHKLREELLSIESGHSELYCTRCGWSQDIWM